MEDRFSQESLGFSLFGLPLISHNPVDILEYNDSDESDGYEASRRQFPSENESYVSETSLESDEGRASRHFFADDILVDATDSSETSENEFQINNDLTIPETSSESDQESTPNDSNEAENSFRSPTPNHFPNQNVSALSPDLFSDASVYSNISDNNEDYSDDVRMPTEEMQSGAISPDIFEVEIEMPTTSPEIFDEDFIEPNAENRNTDETEDDFRFVVLGKHYSTAYILD